MDNTLLRSRIDFESMKIETYQFLASRGILPKDFSLQDHTSSTIIDIASKNGMMTDELLREMWEIPKKFEMLGMQNVVLESGVVELLHDLKGKYRMVIVTNNSIAAAETALREHEILHFFDTVVGRELMRSLKPSPDGFLYILDRFRNISAEEWISVGDAWIDGKASASAGIKFISYRGDKLKMENMSVYPSAEIADIREIKNYL
ncbi:HAD-IA family hydrolase [Cohnella sp. CFH 77786]|nr:HAD-IA family hydrolase [Cohnella sp. CFH 77786]